MSETPAEAAHPARARKGGSKALRVAAALVLLAAVIALGRSLGARVYDFAGYVDGLGFWAPAVFAVGYAIATVAFVPGAILTLAAGAIFGVLGGFLYVFIGAVIGSAAAFLLARHAARGAIERRLEGNRRFDTIQRAVAARGRRIVFLLRLSPVFPFNLLNYALGLTRVSFQDYCLASLGMIPGTLLYVYYGAVAGEVAALAGGAPVERGAGYYAVLGLGLVATVVVTTLVTRLARRALREATGE